MEKKKFKNFFFLIYYLDLGCTFCGGLGHRINNCPKLEQQRRQQMNAIMSGRHGGGGGGGDF